MSVVKSHENYSLESAKKQFMVVDDFLGRLLRDEWTESGSAGGSMALQDGFDGGVVRITTGAVLDDYWGLYWNNIRSLLVSKKVCMEVRSKAVQATYIEVSLAVLYDWSNFARFYANETAGGATNWIARCISAGTGTSINTGIALDSSYHIFRVECHTHGANHVHFYIDGTLVATITTNIPANSLQSYIMLATKTALARNLDVDYVVIKEDR